MVARTVRDENALEAASARPRHRWSYSPGVRLLELAAAYAFGLMRDHPYVDGNVRTSLVALVAFLDDRDSADTPLGSSARARVTLRLEGAMAMR